LLLVDERVQIVRAAMLHGERAGDGESATGVISPGDWEVGLVAMRIERVSDTEDGSLCPSIPLDRSLAGPARVLAQTGIWSDGDQVRVSFEIEAAAYFDDSIAAGTFQRGLWKFDCGELWLYSPQTGRYLEFNLAPNGAWWAMVFSGPRVEDPSCSPPDSRGVGRLKDGKWSASLTTSWAEIWRCLDAKSGFTGNITLVLGGCPDSDLPLENFHSLVTLGGVQPDFHRPGDWTPLEFL